MIVPAFSEAGAQLEVVGGGSGPSAEAASRQRGFARVAPSAAAVINDESVDLVAICTRHDSHAELTRQALEAGKHVFCEKPLALTLDELSDVIRAANASPGLLLVGFNRRFSPFLRRRGRSFPLPTRRSRSSTASVPGSFRPTTGRTTSRRGAVESWARCVISSTA